MLQCRLRIRNRKRSGATLVEMLIALVVLSVMLFSIMAVMIITTQGTAATKEATGASLAILSELERMETQRVSGDVSDSAASDTGIYSLEREVTKPSGAAAGQGVITITAERGGIRVKGGMRDKDLTRQVSPNAWQNAGELP